MEVNKDKLIKIASIILLGAIGSGLWQFVGEPTAGFIYDQLISGGGWVAKTFGDFVNDGIGSGGWESRGSILIMLITLSGLAIVATILFVYKERSLFLAIPFFILIILFVTSYSYKTMHAHKLTLYITKNIEILAPYVDAKEVLKARELYRRIDDTKTYDLSLAYIYNLSEKYDIDIEKF